jgi:hypothetical protein
MIDRHVRGRKQAKTDSRRSEVSQFLHVALVGYHETRPAEDEEEIAAAESIEASMITGGDFSAGQILVGSKDEQERLFMEAERDYESRMSKLADAQLTQVSCLFVCVCVFVCLFVVILYIKNWDKGERMPLFFCFDGFCD